MDPDELDELERLEIEARPAVPPLSRNDDGDPTELYHESTPATSETDDPHEDIDDIAL